MKRVDVIDLWRCAAYPTDDGSSYNLFFTYRVETNGYNISIRTLVNL